MLWTNKFTVKNCVKKIAQQEGRATRDSLDRPTKGSLSKVCSPRIAIATWLALTKVRSPGDSLSTRPSTGLALCNPVPVIWSPQHGLHSPASPGSLRADQSSSASTARWLKHSTPRPASRGADSTRTRTLPKTESPPYTESSRSMQGVCTDTEHAWSMHETCTERARNVH